MFILTRLGAMIYNISDRGLQFCDPNVADLIVF
jgi:hypothetical protein